MTTAAQPPMLLADSVGLDFLNSLATPVDTPVDWLADGEGLLSWLRHVDLVPADVLEAFRTSAGPGELDALATQARALREWFRGFVLKHMGRTLTQAAVAELAPLNRILARDEGFGQVVVRRDPDSGKPVAGLAWEPGRRWRSPDSLLLPIAEAIGELVTTDDFADVKACQGHSCTLLFVDRTRSRARRWCSMAICGNRAKQAAHRERAGKRPRAG
ncbi:CGNR zinc finger domain-containing protein [Frateuria hangzhouensis]|uniref:CGNR zinc finger domain-containing protein n=1 Tax=Frateuria hangzhouensis TaxID=2995589 RepID=UPI00226096DD|nr:ABATE domain-containing protein [Frateuria sp. STR12]MCX7513061.1 CGNR zinc finger domain-containing protein [Frateuria sp. STR12]